MLKIGRDRSDHCCRRGQTRVSQITRQGVVSSVRLFFLKYSDLEYLLNAIGCSLSLSKLGEIDPISVAGGVSACSLLYIDFK